MRDKLKALPGVQIVMAQPISDRVDEMVTGVRSDIAVKVFGDDLDQLKKTGRPDRQGRARRLQGAQDLRIERISGQQYLIGRNRPAGDRPPRHQRLRCQ